MAKLVLTDVASLINEQSALQSLANNNLATKVAVENTLSRDGTSPNAMSAPLDMNSNRILNLPSPVSPTDPVRLGDVNLSTVVVTKELTFGTKALAVAASIGLSVDIIHTLGYATPGDNGGALYKRIAPTSAAPWRFTSADGQWWELIEQDCKPEMFGAIPVSAVTAAASVPDSTSATQAALSYLSYRGGGELIFSTGMYGISSVSVAGNALRIRGTGIYSTVILHKPTAPSSCFFFSVGASILLNCGISDLTIVSADTTLNKIAINVQDASVFESKNVRVGCYPFDGSNGSMYRGATGSGTALYIAGREHGHIENFTAYANIPIEIGANLNFPAISLDSWTFRNCFFYTTYATNHCVLIDNGVNLFNVVFDGAQNWVGGKDGLHWVDGTSTLESDGLYISGVKLEQGVDPTGYMINIQHNTALKGFALSNSIGGGDRRGLNLRKVVHGRLENYSHQQSAYEGLNLDATALTFAWHNCFWWSASFITISGLTRVWQGPIPASANGSTTIPSNALYTASTAASLFSSIAVDTNVESGTFNNVSIPHPASTAVLNFGAGKTVTFNSSLAFSGTDGTVMTFPTTSATVARTDAAQTFTGVQTFSSTITGNISGNAATATTATTASAVPLSGITGAGTGVLATLAIAVGSAGGPVTFNGALGTPSSGTGTNLTGVPISTGISGLAANVATWLTTPTSANLRAVITDEVGTGAAYFVGGVLGTPASGVGTNLTGIPLTTGVTGVLPIANGGTNSTGGAVVTVKKQAFTATGTYTPSTGMLYCIIECVGGGGGGGSAAGTAAQTYSGGGGGGGGYSRLYASAATIGASKAVTIGTAGAGGASGSNNGSAGGDTSVGVLCIGKGGSGGLFGSAAQVGIGGNGGVAGTGDVTSLGNPGGAGVYVTATGSLFLPTNFGANSYFGPGAQPPTPAGGGTAPGNNATANTGGGGSGGTANAASNTAGGNGGTGYTIITEFCNQ